MHGFERATNDIALFVRTSETNIAAMQRALRRVFDDPGIDEITASDLAGEYPTVRYAPPEGDWFIDILGRLGTAISYDDLEYQEIDLEGVIVRIATPRTLYRMKRDTVRPIDKVDAAVLRERFGLEVDD